MPLKRFPMSCRRLVAGLVVLYAIAAGSAAAQDQAAPPNDAQLASRVDEYMMRLGNLGYTGGVLVIRNGRPMLKRRSRSTRGSCTRCA